MSNGPAGARMAGMPSTTIEAWMEQHQQHQSPPIPSPNQSIPIQQRPSAKQGQLVRGAASLRYSHGPPQAFHRPSEVPPTSPSLSDSSGSSITRSSSQPDLTMASHPFSADRYHRSDPWFTPGAGGVSVIRVWRSLGPEPKDQVSKLVPLHPKTTAKVAVRLAAAEFNLEPHSGDDVAAEFCLCLVTVNEGPIMRQSRIADTTDDLANRINLNSRYYLKPNRISDVLITDEVAKVIYQESRVSLTQLSAEEVAIQLTLDDFAVFRSIETSEFVDKVFGLCDGCGETATNNNDANSHCENPNAEKPKSREGFATGCSNLNAFSDLVNREAYWVPSELCAETNLQRRVEMLKRFIKIAKLCKDLRNFNTMFCILVGLHMAPVERLRSTWERLPNKYVKMSRDLAMVLDPSRNFAHYRNLLNSTPGPQNVSSAVSGQSATTFANQSGTQNHPLVPYLPLVLKDLTFIHLGNPSRSSPQLINFAKLRMFAKEIRSLRRMCDVDYDLSMAQRLLQSGGSSNKLAALLAGASGGGVSIGSNAAANNIATTATIMDISAPQPAVSSSFSSSINSVNSNIPGVCSNTSVSRSPAMPDGSRKAIDGGVASLLSGATALLLPTATGPNHSSPTRTTVLGLNGIGGVKKAKAKAIYAAWQMRLRVRTYMSSLTVTEDLEKLSQLSQRAEPGSGSISGPSPPPVAKETTPTPAVAEKISSPSPPQPQPTATKANQLPPIPAPVSGTATISSQRSIFGNQSIEDARKLIALQERTSRRRMRMYAVPNYQHHHQQQQAHLFYQQCCQHGFDQRLLQQRGGVRYPTPCSNAHQLLQVHQQHQYQQQQQAAAQWVAKQQALANQRGKMEVPKQQQQAKPLPPNYDYAMALKMQQQQQQQQQSQQIRSMGYVRRSSEPPPRGTGVPMGPPVGVKSPQLTHWKPTPPTGASQMQRPPLPSYHEVVAMKQQQHLGLNPQQQQIRGPDGRPLQR